MANTKVALQIRIRLSDGRRVYAAPAFAKNRKLKPLIASVNGKDEHHPEGVYVLRYRNSGRLTYKHMGSDPCKAEIELIRQQLELKSQRPAARSPRSHLNRSPSLPSGMASKNLEMYRHSPCRRHHPYVGMFRWSRRLRRLLQSGTLLAVIFGMLLSASLFVLPQYLRGVQDYNATRTALFFCVDAIATYVSLAFGAKFARRLSSRVRGGRTRAAGRSGSRASVLSVGSRTDMS
jgi:hypothetical protein